MFFKIFLSLFAEGPAAVKGFIEFFMFFLEKGKIQILNSFQILQCRFPDDEIHTIIYDLPDYKIPELYEFFI